MPCWGSDPFQVKPHLGDGRKKQVDKIDPVRSKFGKIEKEEVTLPDVSIMSRNAKSHGRFSFRELLKAESSKTQIVVTSPCHFANTAKA